MPFHNPLPFEVTDLAQQDLESIFHYTLVNHGYDQAIHYRTALMSAISIIAETPDVGAEREDLPGDYHAFPVEKHWIIYTIQDNTIFITRILHQKMDIANHVH